MERRLIMQNKAKCSAVWERALKSEMKCAGPSSPLRRRTLKLNLQDWEEDGQEDNGTDQITAPKPLPMAGYLLFACTVGNGQRYTADRLDLFKLGGLIVAGGQGAAIPTERKFGLLRA